jgi:hypothetical protein
MRIKQRFVLSTNGNETHDFVELAMMTNHQALKNPQSCGLFNIESLTLKELPTHSIHNFNQHRVKKW